MMPGTLVELYDPTKGKLELSHDWPEVLASRTWASLLELHARKSYSS